MTAPQQPPVYVQPPQKPFYKKLGCMIPLILVILFILFVGGCTVLFGKAAKDVSDDLDTERAVVYEISGDTQDALATYSTGDNGQAQDNGVAAGWSKEVKVKGLMGAYLSATNGFESDGTITCTIKANGKELVSNTASGTGASATCNASQDDISKAYKE